MDGTVEVLEVVVVGVTVVVVDVVNDVVAGAVVVVGVEALEEVEVDIRVDVWTMSRNQRSLN